MCPGQGYGARQALLAGVALITLAMGGVRAQETEITIPAQPLGDTLRDIARKTGANILFTPDAVSGLRSPALSGRFSAQDAVTRALAGSDLDLVPDGNGGFIVVKAQPKAPPAVPQPEAPRTIAPPTETVIVTGSRLPEAGITSASPVVMVRRPELKFEGTTDVATLVDELPEAFFGQNSNVSNGATGTANVNLRGLGSARSLVLVDGTRLMPGDPLDPVADLNFIPAALVDHIEVFTGGASAVYGSDALAGVVNFIMRKDFEGIELDETYSSAQNDNSNAYWRSLIGQQIRAGAYGTAQAKEGAWDGRIEDGTFLIGVNSPNGKGNITAYLGYRSAGAVLESARDYSECPLQSTGSGFTCRGSPSFNRWLSFDNLFYDAAQGGAIGFDYFECSVQPVPGCPKGSKGTFAPYTGAPDQLYNFGAVNYFQRPDTRYTGGFFAHYRRSSALEVYTNFMFADDRTVAQIAQSGLFLGAGNGFSGTDYVNCSNPLMTANENVALCGQLPGDSFVPDPAFPAGGYWNGQGNVVEYSSKCGTGSQIVPCNPGAVPGQSQLLIGRRDLEGGYRQSELRHTALRAQIGARGDLPGDWSYDVYGQYGLTVFGEEFSNEFSRTRVQNALEVDPATGKCYTAEQAGGDPNCVPLDLFSGFGGITPAMLAYVGAHAMEEGRTEESLVSGSITGNLAEWGGRSPWADTPIGLSAGAEYRQEKLAFVSDAENRMGDLAGNSAILSVPASGFDVREGFAEIRLPLVENMPFIEDAALKGGFRYSSYDTAGATETWYGAAEWQPVDDFRFRASVQRAARAPNVLELFTPHLIGVFTTSWPGGDPCATIVTGQCANVPNAGTSLLDCPASMCNQQTGGNLHLKVETSTTRTAGIVLTPSFIDGLTATVDVWDIEVANYISALPAAEILNDCYGTAATPEGEAFFCPFVHRTQNGALYGLGYVATDAINSGYLKTRGIDFTVDYEADSADWGWNEGTFSLDVTGTWLDRLDTEAVPVTPLTSAIASQSEYNCAGLYGTICGVPSPKWRHKLRLTWATRFDVQFSVQWRYIGAVGLDADTSTALLGGGPGLTQCAGGSFSVAGIGDCADARIASYSYFDLSASWDLRKGVELRAGVDNIFDIEPPALSQSVLATPFSNGNTFTGLYDTLGRTVFVAATLKL